jgi:hypothetical protein
MYGKDDYFAITPGRGPSIPDTITLPPIVSLYWHPPMEGPENDNDVRRW